MTLTGKPHHVPQLLLLEPARVLSLLFFSCILCNIPSIQKYFHNGGGYLLLVMVPFPLHVIELVNESLHLQTCHAQHTDNTKRAYTVVKIRPWKIFELRKWKWK